VFNRTLYTVFSFVYLTLLAVDRSVKTEKAASLQLQPAVVHR